MKHAFGIVGLGVMGSNLALNVEEHGFPVAAWDRHWDKTEGWLADTAKGTRIAGARTLMDLVAMLERPRRVLVMVKAGEPVDQVVDELKRHLEHGDVIVDGGNSHASDTERRMTQLASAGIRFVGMGVSGGEEGARHGPSLMPGGDPACWPVLEPVLRAIAAEADSGPCVTWVGTKGAGHFAKTVHNGIEYGDMQLIAEAWDLMRNGLGMEAAEIADVFAEWNRGELRSYLVEITSRIVAFPDDQEPEGLLVDRILDEAGQKGTGRWTIQSALDLTVPVPTIAAAVDARVISAHRSVRERLAKAFPEARAKVRGAKKRIVERLRAALYASKVCSYAQGFDLLRVASVSLGYDISLAELARIWKAGCIIRARFLDDVRAAYARDAVLPSLILDPAFAKSLAKRMDDWRATVALSIELGITMPAMSASLSWFDSVRRARGTAALIQAQRDLFGAHGYERVDRPGSFHTDWTKMPERVEAPRRTATRSRKTTAKNKAKRN